MPKNRAARCLTVPLHVHDRYDEAFYLIGGELRFAVGDTPGAARTGAFVFIPRGQAHRFWNASPAAARMLVIGSSEDYRVTAS